MSDNLNYLKGFNSYISVHWNSFLKEELLSLQESCRSTPTFLEEYEPGLYIPSRISDNDFLQMCILINLLPEYNFFKLDLRSETWKRFYRPNLLYSTDKQDWTIRFSSETDSISGILRPVNVNREYREIFPFNVHCVGVKIGSNSFRKFEMLQYCYILTDSEEGALERFLLLVHSQKQENWLYGNILKKNRPEEKRLFRFRRKKYGPVRIPQRKRGYNDKGTLRDPTSPHPEAAPFAEEELIHLQKNKESTLEYLDILCSRLRTMVSDTRNNQDCFKTRR